MKTIIRKYDKERVAIIPANGLPVEFARYLTNYAKVHFWKDFKIVQTKDKWQQLGVVCKPRQWIKLIHNFRSKGMPYPVNYEDEFRNLCIKVMTEKEAFVENKPVLTKDEKEAVKEIKEKTLELIDKGLEDENEENPWKKEKEL